MSDPRYSDPMNDPVRRDPLQPGTPRYDVQDDGSRTGMWAWILGIFTVIVLAMVVYDYSRPISTASSPPVNPPSTTGSAPPQTAAPPLAPAPKAP
jgi:hypothetical protein